MPRTRKTRTARASVEPFWKIGLYIRLSREDDNEDDSESIINQELLCKGWSHHLIHMTAVHLWQNGTLQL